MFHLHADAAGSKFIEHLPNPLLTGLRSLRSRDPTEVVVLLLPRPLLVGDHRASRVETIVAGHRIQGTPGHETRQATAQISRELTDAG